MLLLRSHLLAHNYYYNIILVILQCVQAAIDHQLTLLAQNNPSQKVAVVTFGDEVRIMIFL